MKVAEAYSHKGALDVIPDDVIYEVIKVIQSVDAREHWNKKSREKKQTGRPLLSPKTINSEIKEKLGESGWETNRRIKLNTPPLRSEEVYHGYREIDFVKRKIGVEVQFGKYSFAVYDILSKMVIFSNNGIIEAGIEVRPTRLMAKHMSTGVGDFEMVVTDLHHRGVADIDIPVLVLGIQPLIMTPPSQVAQLVIEKSQILYSSTQSPTLASPILG